MTRYAGGLALAGFAAAVLGCAPAKELPTDVPAADTIARDATPTAPARSEPDAKAVVDKALATLTGGKPELLDRCKRHRATIQVRAYGWDTSKPANESVRTVAAAWPDRAAAVDRTEFGGVPQVIETWLRRPDLIVRANGVPQQAANAVEFESNRASDVVGQNWMPLLVPLADPRAVVFDKKPFTTEKRELHIVTLALGDYPHYQLYFDARTDHLIRCEYATKETGVPQSFAVIFKKHDRHPSGLLVPYEVECLRNKAVIETWAVEKWEFPDDIKDEVFSPPSPKK